MSRTRFRLEPVYERHYECSGGPYVTVDVFCSFTGQMQLVESIDRRPVWASKGWASRLTGYGQRRKEMIERQIRGSKTKRDRARKAQAAILVSP